MSKSKMIMIKIIEHTSPIYGKIFPAIILSPSQALFWYPENEYPTYIMCNLFSIVHQEEAKIANEKAPESTPRSDIDVLFFKLRCKYEIKKITVEF